ncbi:MAG: Zn-dependent hydrolase, partial [Bacteroidales bacterium]|nr:Zn-dependent hydrolase [Bacteroidales bacterium]
MKRIVFMAMALSMLAGCRSTESAVQKKVEEYATFEVSSPLMDNLSDKDRQVLNLFRQAAYIIDDLFWKQTFGDKSLMEELQDPYERAYARINYGPWDRLDDNNPFVKGYGPKPLGAQYYPEDMTEAEFAAFDDPDKLSLYTVIRRDDAGNLKTVWYHDEYRAELEKICLYLEEAATIADNEGLRRYLLE